MAPQLKKNSLSGWRAAATWAVACLLAVAFFFPALGSASPVRVLILTGASDLPYHDWRQSTPYLRGLLEHTGRFEVKVLEEVRGATAATLAPYDVLVLNYNGPRWGQTTEAAMEEFVRSGKGMLVYHGVSYGEFFGMERDQGRWVASSRGDHGWTGYAEMTGQTWKPENIGHSLRHAFEVKWVDREHPIARGLAPTFLANDELYHKMDLKPNAHVLATASSDPSQGGTGKEEPLIWTVPFGRGRVVHITLGHDLAAMHQPGFRAAFARGVEWAATGEVTLPAEIPAHAQPRRDAVRLLVVTGGHSYPSAFFTLFEGYDDLVWTHAGSQEEAFTRNMKDRFDAVLLHDMADTISSAAQANLRAFVESGRGVVSTHHAIVDYTSWPWWYEEVIGGKYFIQPSGAHGKSSYKDDVEIVARPVKEHANHPVIRGLGPLLLVDEAYKNMWHSPRITVLMETDNPHNDRPAVYLGPHPKVRAVYIQFGHNEETLRHPAYRKLVRNAVMWAAGRLP